ncbi:MAG: hypothetical protein ACOYN0_00570 [Phycisphaerales bacterium]
MHSPARRGTVYIFVLAAALIVVALGIAAVAVSRSRLAAAVAVSDRRAARAAAVGTLEAALDASEGSLSWRESLRSGGPVVSGAAGGVSVEGVVSDPADANLSDDWTEPIQIEAEGSLRGARQRVSAEFSPRFRSSSGLGAALCAGGSITLNSALVDVVGTVAAGKDIIANGSTQAATLWSAGGTISGTGYTGTTATGAAALELPTEDAIAYLEAEGTGIRYSSTGGLISSLLLSSAVNPYGSANPRGIYYIRCGRSPLVLKNCRIRGTLVVLEAGASFQIEGAVNIEPAEEGLPALVVDGELYMMNTGADLSESALSRNFNPAGSPYEGVSDSDQTDTYANMITGIVWVTGSLKAAGPTLACDGTIAVTGDAELYGSVLLRHREAQTLVPGLARVAGWDLNRATVRRRVD